jgi:beta-1,4-mannosyl-glycoprotein beta-1,4-N-acetylglucosaminyltransferase|tara:strand:+ start:811 stop:1707 length:897 start_codon:yes stop_codon:yes gene_type:complete
MKVFDCTTYFNEPLLFELRLNILNDYVDEFIVCEAKYTHSGQKKKINFNKNNYPNFKKKITHIVADKEPDDLFEINETNKFNNSLFRLNAGKRIEKQRNEIVSHFDKNNSNDWIIYSDSDEIPDLSKIDLNKSEKKIILFKQKVFYYKFNLILKSHDWYGSKACRLKDLKSFSNLRNIKTKKYNWWRLDTIFKNNKFINLKVINEGGWHFTEIKSPNEIYVKHKNDEHHDEFDLTGINESDIENMVKNRYIAYDHSADKRDLKHKWNKTNRIYLSKINDNKLPKYLIDNKNKYLEWFA